MGPLSAKQHREYLKLEADEKRKQASFLQEQQRKDQLHNLKLQEAAAKASQGITHKEENHTMKLAEGTFKVPRINRQKLGLPSMNPLAGTEVLGQGQKQLPMPKGTDTVPAMLTPGEAVIPAPAAQNPKNKKAIKRMVNEGRKKNKEIKGYADGSINIKPENEGKFTKKADAAGMNVQEYAQKVLAAPLGKYDPSTRKQANFARNATQWHADGTTGVSYYSEGTPGVAYYEDGATNVSFLDRLLNRMAGQTIPQPTEVTPAPAPTPVPTPDTQRITATPVPGFNRMGNVPAVVPPVAPAVLVPEPILLSQRRIESGNMNVYPEGHPKAGQLVTSPAGALGIAQIRPTTAADPGFGIKPISMEDLKDSRKAIKFQGDYMAAMSSRYNGDIEKALTAYNAGPGSVDKAVERANKAGRPEAWKEFLPTQEAKEYSAKVMADLTKAPLQGDSPGTGFASNAGGAAFGNPNITRGAAKSVPRQEALARGDYQAVPNTAPPTPAMQEVRIPDTQAEAQAAKVPPLPAAELPKETTAQPEPVQKDERAFEAVISSFSQQVAPQIDQAATEANKIEDPVERKTFLENFISNLYGEKGLFNEKDLARFAIVTAGGILTGARTGRAVRYAARDVLANADKRSAIQTQQEFEREKIKAVDDRTERNKLIDQGYEPAAIDKYLKSRQVAHLGVPRTTFSFKETGKQVTVDRGPQSGMTFQVVEAVTKTGKGAGDTTLMVVDPRTGNKIPFASFQANAQKLGYNIVDYSAAQHSPLARANRVKEWVEKDATTIAEQAVEQTYGASNVKGKPNTARANVPTSAAMGAQAASFFKSIGFEPSDANEMLEAKNIMNVAVKDMIADQQGRSVKVEDLTPYLSRSMITVRSGISPDLFKIGSGDKAKLMPPEKIVQLDYLVKQASAELGGGQTNPAAQQALYQRMATTWNNNPKLREKYLKPGPEESSFYMFMKDTLSKGLKE